MPNPVIDSTLVPVTISSEIVQAVSETSVVLKLAKKQPMPTGAVTVPVMKVLPTSGWVAGTGARKPVSTIEWSSEQLIAEEVAALIAVPTDLIDDAGIPIWTEVRANMVDALAFSVDSAILFGTNAPASFPAGGVAGQAIAAGMVAHVPGAAGAQPDIAACVNAAMGDVEAGGLNVTGNAADVILKAKFRGLRATTGEAILTQNVGESVPDALWGYPTAWSGSGAFNNTVADLITGDWSKLIVGVRRDITIEQSTQATIVDAGGVVLVNAWQDDQVIMRVRMRIGYVIGVPVTRRAGAGAFPFGLVKA